MWFVRFVRCMRTPADVADWSSIAIRNSRLAAHSRLKSVAAPAKQEAGVIQLSIQTAVWALSQSVNKHDQKSITK